MHREHASTNCCWPGAYACWPPSSTTKREEVHGPSTSMIGSVLTGEFDVDLAFGEHTLTDRNAHGRGRGGS